MQVNVTKTKQKQTRAEKHTKLWETKILTQMVAVCIWEVHCITDLYHCYALIEWPSNGLKGHLFWLEYTIGKKKQGFALVCRLWIWPVGGYQTRSVFLNLEQIVFISYTSSSNKAHVSVWVCCVWNNSSLVVCDSQSFNVWRPFFSLPTKLANVLYLEFQNLFRF